MEELVGRWGGGISGEMGGGVICVPLYQMIFTNYSRKSP